MKFLNRQIRILIITNGFILIARAMLGPIYALFVEEVGGDLLNAAFAFAIYAIVAGIVTLISGKYTDKLKENELIIVFGYGIIGLSFFGYIFVNSIWSLFLIQFILGIGEAIYAPAFDAIYSKYLGKGKSGRDWSIWESVNYFTIAIGAISGGLLVVFFGFNMMFIIMGLLSLSSALYILKLPRSVL